MASSSKENQKRRTAVSSIKERKKRWLNLLPDSELIFRILTPVAAIIFALIVGAIVIAVIGVNPLIAYKELIIGAFGSGYSVSEIFVRAMPLAFAGLAVAFAYRGGLMNIGAEGQIYVGALGATLVALFFTGLPSFVIVILTILASAIFGGIWALIPAILKAKWNVNEFVNTVMMNYIGIYLVNFLISSPLREKQVTNYPQTAIFDSTAWMPNLISGTRLSIGLLILIGLAVVVYILLWHTSFGYQIRVIGFNRKASLYSGMNGTKLLIMNFIIAGALAGVGGGIEATGIQHRLISNFSPGYGYTGITVALIGRNHPFGVIIAALFFGVLRVGSRAMESYAKVPYSVNTIIEAVALIAILSSDYLGRVIFKSKKQ